MPAVIGIGVGRVTLQCSGRFLPRARAMPEVGVCVCVFACVCVRSSFAGRGQV